MFKRKKAKMYGPVLNVCAHFFTSIQKKRSNLKSMLYRNAKEGPRAKQNGDSLRYEYDDHYFMTDPEVCVNSVATFWKNRIILLKSIRRAF